MPHPDLLLPRLTSGQWSDWLAFARLEPFGPQREDRRAGVLASLIANANRDPKKRAEAWGPEHFFTELAPEPIPIAQKLRNVFGRFRKAAPGEVKG